MTEEQQKIVWSEEAKKIGKNNNTEFFTPETGKNQIEFLGEGQDEEKDFSDEDEEPEPEEFRRFKVIVDGEEMKWDVRKATSESSLYGQIVLYADAVGGLEGESIELYRQGTGMNTSYVLTDLSEIQEEDGDSDSDDVVFGEDDEEPEEDEELFDGEKAEAKA